MNMPKNPVLPAIFLNFCLIFSTAHAEVNVVVNDPTTGQPLTTQPTTATASSTAPTLTQTNKPTDSQLSQANQQLLTQNAELQRQVSSLNTQNNVLVNEKSGQLLVYGGFIALLSAVIGLLLGWFIFGRNKSTW